MKKSLLFLSSIVLISCGSTKLAAPTQADVDRGAKKYPELTLEELNAGKMNFEKKCTQCHGLKKPSSKTESQWTSIVPKMAARAEKKPDKQPIDGATQESIIKYLHTMAKQ